jgi:hypothetical protein
MTPRRRAEAGPKRRGSPRSRARATASVVANANGFRIFRG